MADHAAHPGQEVVEESQQTEEGNEDGHCVGYDLDGGRGSAGSCLQDVTVLTAVRGAHLRAGRLITLVHVNRQINIWGKFRYSPMLI